MTEIAPLDRFHLPQALELVNGHLGAAMPGWSLTPDYLWGCLHREPQESVTDPWVVERRSIVGIVKDRVCAAAHLRRYGEETPWKGVGEIGWILYWPGEREAGAAVMAECRRQMEAWQVAEERASGSLPVPGLVGIPDVWPHIGGLLEEFGYSAKEEVDESLYAGTLDGIPAPGEAPAEGVTMHREMGRFGTRFAARLEGQEISECECIADLTEGGQLPSLAGWAELFEIQTSEAMRNRGVGSWVVRHVVEWLRLGRYDRIVVPVAREDEQAGAGRFYMRFGWTPLVRQRRGWRRALESRDSAAGKRRRHMTPNFDDYADTIRSLPPTPEENDVLNSRFLLGSEDRLEVYYAPLHGITASARVVIVGLTPGKSQMLKAFQAARTLLSQGWRPPRIFDEIRRRMAFAGPMRTNLITMLDKIGVAERLDLPTTAALFDDASGYLHSTSALRYPVLKNGQNYSGTPNIDNSRFLSDITKANLLPELQQHPNALIVPLGRAVERALAHLDLDCSRRTLWGFPHPSGGNGHRVAQFKSEYRQLRRAVSDW